MALEYKKRSKQNLLRYEAGVIDTSANSPDYFRVSSIPEYFGNGKNAFRILGSDSDLLAPNSEIKIEVLDSKGNAIYHEIPNYQATDGSRLVTVWIYSGRDVSRENTPQGVGTIVIVGITRDNQLVRWTRSIPIRPAEPSIAPIIFQSPNLPTATCSASLDSYSSIPQTADGISLTTQSTKVKYIKSNYGEDISLQRSGSFGSNFTGEMVDGEIRLDLSDITLYPQSKGTSQPTDYTGSIKAISGSDIIRLVAPITASDPRGDGSTHTYIYSDTADISGSIIFFSSASNASTENFEAVANITIPNLSPILGNVYSLNTSIKSKGFGGDFETLANTRITTDTNITYKVKIPSKHIGDPKTLRIQFLNKNGEISDSVILIEDVIFEGANSYIGGQNSLITGSIFISNALGSGIEIGGASSGFIRSVGFDGQTSASLGLGPGGFIFYSGSGNLQVGADTLNGVGMQMIGDNDDRHFIFTTENGGLLDVKTDKFFIGTTDTQFISGSEGNIEISSSLFHLDPKNDSLVIGADATILADLTVNNIRTPAVVNGAPSTETNSSSSIKSDGFARFVSASIGGWGVTTGSIEGGNLIMRPEGILQTRDFASGLKGWKISSEGNGTAEFENIRIRGTLRTTTFEKESVNAVGGQLWVANATTITGSVLSTETTMSVKNASGFSQGEILLIKRVDGTGFQTEYVLLNSASIDGDNSGEDETHGRIMVTRAYGSGSQGDFVGDLASAAQAYEDGQVIVSTGKLNTGYIKMNANPNDTSTPFIDIVERTGSGLYDVALKARIGDLGGIAGNDLVYGNSNPGFGIATDNVFLQGGIIARTGSIGGINMEAGKLFIGTGTHGNSNTGFYVDSSSNFSLGDRLVWDNDATTLTIRGTLQFPSGDDVQQAINDVTASNTAKVVSLTADSYVITFDADGNEDPPSQTIGLTASAQNFGDDTVYYEFYKGTSLQGSRTTTNTFTVDTPGEKPTSTTPVTYEVRTFTGSSGGTSIASDSLTLFGIKPGSSGSDGADGADGTDGADAYTVILTNESHTLQTANDGTVTFTDSGTDIVVYKGVTELNGITAGSPTTGQFKVTASGTNISVGGITSPSNPVVVADHSSMTADTAKVTFTIDAEGSSSFTKIQSLSKAKEGSDGLDGTNAKILTITADSQVFAFDDASDNTAADDDILLIINQQNLSGTVGTGDLTIVDSGGTTLSDPTLVSDVTNGSGQVSGSITFSSTLSATKSKLPITVTVAKDGLEDSIKIFKVEGGADGTDGAAGVDAVTAFLTNENHTFAAQNDGTIISFTGGSTDMEVFEGITNKTSNYGFAKSDSTGVTSTLSGNTVTVTAMSHDSGSITITATSASVSLAKTMSLAKSKQGNAGEDGADGTPGTPGSPGPPGADNQDFTWANENLTGVGPASAGLLMTSNVFGFHNGISGANGTLDDFTSYLDSDGNFYLGSGSTSGTFLNWNNTEASLFITGSLVDIRVSKFILGQIGGSDASYISGSNGKIEISASNFHLSSSGDVTVKGDITAETGTFKDVNVLGGNVQLGASGSHNVTEKYRSSTGTLLDYPIYPGQEPITVSDAPLWVETWVTQSNPAVTVADKWQLKDVIGSGVGTGAVAKHTIGSDGKLFGGQNVWNRFRTAEVGAISGNYQIGHYSASLTLEAIRGYGIGPNAARGANDYGSIESTKQFRTILSMGGDIEDYEQPIYVSSGSWSGSEKLFNDAVSFLKPILRNLPRNGKIQGIFPRYMDTSNIGENYRIGITSDPIVIGQEITLSDVLTLQFDASFSGNWDGFGFIVRAEILTEGGTVLGTFEQISNNPKHVLQFDIPLSQTLRTVTSYAPSIVDVFRIRVSWYQKTILGGGSPGVATQIKLSEMRIVKGVRSTSLNVGMLSVNNKVAITGREITTSNSVQPVMVINGNITPEESGIYSLGENSLYQGFQRYWKDFYMNGKMQLFDGSTTKFFVDKNAVSSSNIYPLTTDIYSVGKSSSQYKSFWGGSSQYLQYGYNPTFNNAASFTEVTTVNGVTNGQGYRMPIGGKITHLSGQCDVVSGGLYGRYLRVGIWKNNVQQFILGQGYQNLIHCTSNGDHGGNLQLSSYVSYNAGDRLMLKIQVSNVNLSVDDIALIMRVQEEL